MTTKVQVMSQEIIKPSSPTTQKLKIFKLSLLDQLAPSEYTPVIFFYPPTATGKAAATERSNRLKNSLSETLTRFYPIAGRIKDEISIECNDEGVLYLEAQVNCHLMEFLRDPDVKLLNQYLPFDLYCTNSTSINDVQLAIQVNNFDCGGMALGLCVLHKIVDCASLSTFVNSWAATARGSNEAVQPNFSSSSLFPQRDSLGGFTLNTVNFSGNPITRRFVFDASNIKALKLKASKGIYGKPPTSVEVISSLIWRSAMAASRTRRGTWRPSMVVHAVNLRGRMMEPLPGHSIGNILALATASSPTGSDNELDQLVFRLREAITKIDGDYIRKVQGENEEEFLMLWESFTKEAGTFYDDGVDCYWFSSWCRFPVYEADFGWGKPVWVSSVSLPSKNAVILMDANNGEGIEAWVTLEEEEMALLEKDQDLQTFSLLNP